MTARPSSHLTRLIPVIISGTLTGVSVVVTRFALGAIPPMTLAGLRTLIGALGLGAAVIVMRRALPTRPAAYWHMIVGGMIAVGVPTIGFTAALTKMSSGVSSVFTSLVPLFTALIAWVWLKETLTRTRIAGLAMAFGGALVLIFTRTNGLAGTPATDLTPYGLSAFAAFGGAFGAVYSRRHLSTENPIVTGTIQTFAGALLAIPFAIGEMGAFNPSAVPIESWAATLAGGLAGSGIGYLIFLIVLQKHGATIAAMSGYVIALAATALGALFLGEVVSVVFLIGGALILGGVYFVSRHDERQLSTEVTEDTEKGTTGAA